MGSTRQFSAIDILGPTFAVALFVSFAFTPLAKAEPPNTAPEIGNLVSTPDSLFPTQSCDIVCTVDDVDGDELALRWSASGGTVAGAGAMVKWTAPERPGSYSIMVEVEDGKGGYDAGVMVVQVTPNAPPVLNRVVAEPALVLPGGVVRVTSDAADPDGHALGYEWSSTAGVLSGIGREVTWTAPAIPGDYDISVKVYDGLGGESSEQTAVTVAPPDPPVIDSLIVRFYQPAYSKVFRGVYRLLRGSLCECEIECIASAGSKTLTYEWQTTEGTIEGEGAAVLFTPPNQTTVVTVTVTVRDAFGLSASEDVDFNVFLREAYVLDDDEAPGGCGCGR